MNETVEERIKRLTIARDCIDTSYEAGRKSYEALDKNIEELRNKTSKQ